MTRPRCPTCAHGHEAPVTGWECRRYAPRPRVSSYEHFEDEPPQIAAWWPQVSESDWCGEHAARLYRTIQTTDT